LIQWIAVVGLMAFGCNKQEEEKKFFFFDFFDSPKKLFETFDWVWEKKFPFLIFV